MPALAAAMIGASRLHPIEDAAAAVEVVLTAEELAGIGHSTHPFLRGAMADNIGAGEESGDEYADGQITGNERHGVYHVLFSTSDSISNSVALRWVRVLLSLLLS